MSTFIQLHVLTSYPPSNLNRDDLGRPKTAVMGGQQRLRISSQCLKRAWRTSDVFKSALSQHIGTRTKEMGRKIYRALIEGGIGEKKAKEWATTIAGVFGKGKGENKENPLQVLDIEQLAHFSPAEQKGIDDLVKILIREKREPKEQELELLRNDHKAIDIALFGRMLADKPKFNMEAAAQVAHAITVHKAAVEDDFFSAVDDLNTGKVHAGSGHLGEAEFGAGLYYLYVCINKDHLIENLDKDRSLAEQSIRALTEAMLTVSPSGKQNNHASRAYASYVLAEKGTVQPRALSTAFLRPIGGNDIAPKAIEELKKTQENLDKVYERENQKCEINILTGEGKLSELLDFVCK